MNLNLSGCNATARETSLLGEAGRPAPRSEPRAENPPQRQRAGGPSGAHRQIAAVVGGGCVDRARRLREDYGLPYRRAYHTVDRPGHPVLIPKTQEQKHPRIEGEVSAWAHQPRRRCSSAAFAASWRSASTSSAHTRASSSDGRVATAACSFGASRVTLRGHTTKGTTPIAALAAPVYHDAVAGCHERHRDEAADTGRTDADGPRRGPGPRLRGLSVEAFAIHWRRWRPSMRHAPPAPGGAAQVVAEAGSAAVRAHAAARQATIGERRKWSLASRPPRRGLGAGLAPERVPGQRRRELPDRARHLVAIGDHVVERRDDPVFVRLAEAQAAARA